MHHAVAAAAAAASEVNASMLFCCEQVQCVPSDGNRQLLQLRVPLNLAMGPQLSDHEQYWVTQHLQCPPRQQS